MRRAKTQVTASGVSCLRTPVRVEPSHRISNHLEVLDAICARWHPACVVYSRAGGMNWGTPGLQLLEDALQKWADERDLSIGGYSAQEVRVAVAGTPNASRDALAFATMQRLRLIGQDRSSSEWEAVAVGHYHLESVGIVEK